MTKHLRLIMLTLLAMICMGGYSAVGDTYKLVTSVADLHDGDVIVIANSKSKYAMGEQGTSNRKAVQVNIANNIFSYVEGVAELTLKASNNEWLFLSADGYLCASSGTGKKPSNKLTSTKDELATTKATISISGDDATIKFDKKVADRNLIMFNVNNILFSCYASGQQPVQIYKKQGSGKTATTLSFKDLVGEGVTLINGKLANGNDFKGYTATEKDNVAGTIAYAASGDGVATVDEKTGAVTVYPNVFGTMTITATFTPTDTEKYAESTASYTVINERTPTTITFGSGVDNNTFEVKDGDTFEARVAKCTTKGATGSIEYKSSDEAIAKVDATTGVITLGAKYGTAVITATFVATGSFANSEASYSIKHVGDFVFYESFDKCDGYGGNDNKWSGNLLGEELKPERADNPGWTFVNGRERNQCASFGATDNGGSATSPNIQIDQKAQLKFKASRWSTDKEKSQIKISVSDGTLTYNGKNSQSVTIDVVRDTWTDYSMIVSGTNSFTVKFSGSGKYNRFFLDEVMVTKVAPQEITLEENSDNIVEAAENVNVTLKRTFYKDGEWNTLCLPFAVADAKTAFDNAELREVDTEKSNGNTIVFKEATAIEAGKPYLIKWANSSSDAVNVEKKFEGVTLVAAATPVVVKEGGISFNGFYKMTEARELGASVAAIGAGNKLFKVTEGKMKGFRAAFVLSSGAEATKYNVVIDGTATGIEDLVIDGVKANGRVYNLNGQYVGNNLNGLQPGLYIQNGKKIVVK